MRTWNPLKKSVSVTQCEDIKKARTLLRESGENLKLKVDEQRELIQRMNTRPVLVLVN